MRFYSSAFKNSQLGKLTRYGEAGPGKKGTVMTGTFQLAGKEFMALNGGPEFKFTPAISLLVNCESQVEIDLLWEKLSEGGRKDQCGWLQDRFGVSWQIVPTILAELMSDPDPVKAARVTKAMLQMKKLDIAELKRAYAQG